MNTNEIMEQIGPYIMEMMQDEKRQKREQYRRLNCFVKEGQILFAGSSLMEQFPIHELAQDYGVKEIIYNRGIGGFVLDEFEDALQECVFDLKPLKIFINIGTNDLNDAQLNLNRFIEKYERILTKIEQKLPEAEICLMAYYPVNPAAAKAPHMVEMLKVRTNERIQLANEKVKELAAKRGYGFVDVTEPLKDENGCLRAEFSKDGMHFYADGYEAVFQELVKYIGT